MTTTYLAIIYRLAQRELTLRQLELLVIQYGKVRNVGRKSYGEC